MPGGESVRVDDAVVALEGKRVAAIQVGRANRAGAPDDEAASESFVRSLRTRVGQPFEARNVSADCQSLWIERRLVVTAFVRPAGDEVIVTFMVDRSVETYDGVEFTGLRNLDRETVNSLLGLTVDRQVTALEAEAMRKVLLTRYRRDGYAFCSIALEPRPLAEDGVTTLPPSEGTPGRWRMRFAVDEGPEVTVRNVTFLGNRSFAADPVFGLFGTANYLLRDSRIESDPARGFVSGGPFSREILDEDLDRLRLFYRGQGYLDATVDLVAVAFTPERDSVDLTFSVVEGVRYTIRSLRVEHVRDASREPLTTPPLYPTAELAAQLEVAPGEFYDHDRLQRDVQALQDFYGERGHPPASFPGMQAAGGGCQVFPPLEVYGADHTVDLVFQIFEGQPKRLRDVLIRGNRFTRDAVIRRRIRVLPGERIDMVEVRRGQRALEQTRYFQDPTSMRGPRLQLEPVAGSSDLVDIGLDLEDGSTGELRWGIGISTGQGAQGQLQFNKRNFDIAKLPSSPNPITIIEEVLDNKAFHGGGQQLNTLLAPGSRQSQFQMTWIEPDLFGDHFETYEARVTGRRIIRRLPDGYTSDVLGAEVGLSRWLTETISVGLSVRHDTVQVESLATDATALAYDAEGQTELRAGRLNLRYRDFDDPLRMTSGVEIGFGVEMVGGLLGGDESLSKFTHTANWYVPVRENEMGHRTVLHLEQFLGFAQSFGGSDDVFLTERFYMGGPDLRGFDFRRAGPTQFNRPLGGEAKWTATAELFFPLVATRLEGEVRDRELLRGVVFTDLGLLGLDDGDETFRQLRASSGIGIRIEIPFLEVPIALDLGWPWIYEETDDRRQLYFSISR